MTIARPPEAQAIADNVRRFVEREVIPVAGWTGEQRENS